MVILTDVDGDGRLDIVGQMAVRQTLSVMTNATQRCARGRWMEYVSILLRFPISLLLLFAGDPHLHLLFQWYQKKDTLSQWPGILD